MPETLTSREVAEIAGVPTAAVNKAVEERVLKFVTRKRGKRTFRYLPVHAVGYAALVKNLDVTLTRSSKRLLADGLKRMTATQAAAGGKIEVAPAVEVSVGPLAGEAMLRGERYLAARERHIVEDETIKGGTPVIAGTRMTVYSVLGRVAGGDSIEEIAAENPDILPEALEAAVIYAKTHPLVGRPAGKPWRP